LQSKARRKTDFIAIAFGPTLTTFSRHKAPADTMVEQSKYDPFGEPVTMAEMAGPVGASRWLTRAGAGLFWALALAIVTARAVYFEPGVFNGLDRALAFAQNILAAL
jgi:hypothetical protein